MTHTAKKKEKEFEGKVKELEAVVTD